MVRKRWWAILTALGVFVMGCGGSGKTADQPTENQGGTRLDAYATGDVEKDAGGEAHQFGGPVPRGGR
jgi:hypothetical protein